MEKLLKKVHGNKKGFTLVELIVVLVILAILAALLVPALTGYIDRAKEQSITAETRMAVVAAQTVVSVRYGKTNTSAFSIASATVTADIQDTTAGNLEDGFKCANISSIKISTAGKIDELKYTKNGKTCTYTYSATDGGTYKVS